MNKPSRNFYFGKGFSMLLVTFLFIAGIAFQSYGQGEANHWYFGNLAGIDFNYGTPQPLLDGSLSTSEACAAMSNKSGKLLFYTDGMNVWNRHHAIMKNGTGMDGNPSTTQCMILPKPGDSNIYFIFTADLQGGPKGLRYSVLDMSQDGGKGAVIEKNTALWSTTTEKITAARHANGKDFWLISHDFGSARYVVYLIDEKGVHSNPVISKTGMPDAGGRIDDNAIGEMKINPQGNRVAKIIYEDGWVEITDFDNVTGKLSHTIDLMPHFPDAVIENLYGLAFSPDGSKLYCSDILNSYLVQYNLNAGSDSDISHSMTILWHNYLHFIGQIALAPDGLIYFSLLSSPYLGVINNPDALGTACNVVEKGFYLQGRVGSLGLPNMLPFAISRFQYKNVCLGDSTSFSIRNRTGIDSVFWSFDDVGPSLQNNSRSFSPKHLYKNAGTYLTKCIMYSNGTADTSTAWINIRTVPKINIWQKDTFICGAKPFVIQLPEKEDWHYFWQDFSTQSFMEVTEAEMYTVKIYNGCGAMYDTMNVHYDSVPVVHLGKDTVLCEAQTITLNALWPEGQYHWQDGSIASGFTVSQAGTYYVSVKGFCGTASDTIKVGKMRCDVISYLRPPNIFTPNGDGINDLYRMDYKNIDSFMMRIYNRWGQQVYQSNIVADSWTGESEGVPLPEAIYYYVISASGYDGKKYNLRGTVTLLR